MLLLSLPFGLQHGFAPPSAKAKLLIAAWPVTTIFVAPTAGVRADRVHPGCSEQSA